MKVLHIDENHPILWEKLEANGFENQSDYTSNFEGLKSKLENTDGLIVRSRIPINEEFLTAAKKLKFIGRVGAGLENIDLDYCKQNNIVAFNAPEGNRDAVAEHCLGMLLSLMNRFSISDTEVRQGIWKREENRGDELMGKTVGIIGYGNMGKAFAKRLTGFSVDVICYDILDHRTDEFAKQVTLSTFFEKCDVVSLHTPQTPETIGMINESFIENFKKPFYFLNTARGKSVVTKDLVSALQIGKIKAAGLDVLEYEKTSFENLFQDGNLPKAFKYLIESENVILTPHIAGWTHESKIKLAESIADKIIKTFAK